MIEQPGKLVFIHIPKTGGTAITAALKSALPDAMVDSFVRKHWTAWEIAWHTPIAAWEKSYKFCVVRNPWELIESDYRFALQEAGRVSWGQNLPHADWGRKMQRVVSYGGFEEFVRHSWLGEYSPLRPGGFWRTWCLGPLGEDLGVEAFRFEDLDAAWAKVCERLDINHAALSALNRSEPAPLEWSPAVRDAVGQVCWMDVEKFDYQPPGK